MQFVKSLICLKGHDNGRRFLVISLFCYALVFLFNSLMNQAAILLVLILIVTAPIVAASSMRRIHDAGFATPLAALPLLIYLITLFGLTYIDHPSKWALVLLALFSSILVGTISNARVRRNKTYHLGYSGPIDLTSKEPVVTHSDRIEPTIAGQKLSENTTNDLFSSQAQKSNDSYNEPHSISSNDELHWEHTIGLWLSANKKLAATIGLAIILLTILLLSLNDNEPDSVVEPIEQETKPTLVKERLNKLEMPDQFWVMHDQNDSITIAWEGDIKAVSQLGENGSYWSATTGKGDRDCVDLYFILGERIRTLSVTVKNGGDYYADFSPVDSQTIIRSIADKDRFKLCGYEFKLNGTGSLLRKNTYYYQYLKPE